jgi:hypothetical protein
MPTEELPFIAGLTPLENVLDTMKSNGKAAAVVEFPDGLRLVTVKQVLQQIRKVDEGQLACDIKEIEEPFVSIRSTVVLKPIREQIGASVSRQNMNAPSDFSGDLNPGGWVGSTEIIENNTTEEIGKVSARVSESFNILERVGDRITISTTEQRFVDSFRTKVIICRCKESPKSHVWSPEELTQPGICPFDYSQLDCN